MATWKWHGRRIALRESKPTSSVCNMQGKTSWEKPLQHNFNEDNWFVITLKSVNARKAKPHGKKLWAVNVFLENLNRMTAKTWHYFKYSYIDIFWQLNQNAVFCKELNFRWHAMAGLNASKRFRSTQTPVRRTIIIIIIN